MGLYTISLRVPSSNDCVRTLSSLEEDIAWFDIPASALLIENNEDGDEAVVEVKWKDKDMAEAVLQGLKQKYPGLQGDTSGVHVDIVPDSKTGLFTLCFTDSKKKKFKATLDKFKTYSLQPPVITRGLGADQVLVGYQTKEEALEALKSNIDSVEFPKLHVAAGSRR